MTTPRAALEQVLKKHTGYPGNVAYLHNGELLDDLLVCWPRLSREALEKIVYPHRGLSDESMRRVQDELLDKIMAWTEGREHTWCSHWKWDGRYWEPQEQQGAALVAQSQWKFCPLCAHPRLGG